MKERLERLEREAAELRAKMEGAGGAESQVRSPGDADAHASPPLNADGDLRDQALDAQESEHDAELSASSTQGSLQDSGLSAQGSETKTENRTPNAAPPNTELAESLIRQARLARTRGQAQQATAFLKQAEEAAPNAPIVLEFIGDDFAERKQFGKAREMYKKAFDLDPKNAAIETKFANMVLKTEPGISPELYMETTASSKVAVLLSAFVPGLGQIVTKEVTKGIVTMAFWAAMLAWFLIIPDGIGGLMKTFGLRPKGNPELHSIIFVPMAIGFIIWFVSVADMNLKAKVAQRRPIERPKPPDDHPFE